MYVHMYFVFHVLFAILNNVNRYLDFSCFREHLLSTKEREKKSCYIFSAKCLPAQSSDSPWKRPACKKYMEFPMSWFTWSVFELKNNNLEQEIYFFLILAVIFFYGLRWAFGLLTVSLKSKDNFWKKWTMDRNVIKKLSKPFKCQKYCKPNRGCL